MVLVSLPNGGSVEITISAGGDEQALEQFYHWLRNDVDVVRSGVISTAGAPDTGHMGAFEVICMALSTGTGLASFGLAWASFLRTRKENPPFVINVVGTLSDEQIEMLKKFGVPLNPGTADGEG
jgi:membrane-associated two-gene conflict system component 1 (EACC1)